MNSAVFVVKAIFGGPPLLLSLWLPFQWLRSHSSPERWLGFVAYAPLLMVAAHWWRYPAEELLPHIWLATAQTLAFLFVVLVSGALSRRSLSASQRDRNIGLLIAAISGVSGTMFLTLFGEDGGTLDMIAPAFIANPPAWWSIVAHSWSEYFLVLIGLLPASIGIRRGRPLGYFALAIGVSLAALLHWAHYYYFHPYGGSAGSVFIFCVASALCWLLAAHRLVMRTRTA